MTRPTTHDERNRATARRWRHGVGAALVIVAAPCAVIALYRLVREMLIIALLLVAAVLLQEDGEIDDDRREKMARGRGERIGHAG